MDKTPVINMTRCDGDGRCVECCPNQVFELREITTDEYESLGFKGKLKTRIKGRVKSFAVHSENCVQCGLCVEQCHEKAIQFAPTGNERATESRTRPDSSSPSLSMLKRGGYAWFMAVLTIGFVVVSALGFHLAGGSAAHQVPVHQWLGLALAGSMIVHLLLHRTWLSRLLRRQPRQLPRRTRVNRGMVVALSVLVAALLVSGLGLGGLFGEEIVRGTLWQGMHHLAGKLMLLVGTWHIVRHRSWFFRRLRRRNTARSAEAHQG